MSGLAATVGGLALGAVGGQAIFGGFAPFPNSIMIPFMGAQSAVLGYQFGLFYETGKRTIKAMDNDLFNRIVSGSTDKINIIRNGIETTIPINQYLPTLIKAQWEEQITSFRNMLPTAQSLMQDIIQQSVQIELKKAQRTPSAWVEIIKTYNEAISEEVSKETGVPAGTTLQDLLLHLFTQGTKPTIPDPGIELEHTEIKGHEQHPKHPADVRDVPQEEEKPDVEPEPPETQGPAELKFRSEYKIFDQTADSDIEKKWRFENHEFNEKNWVLTLHSIDQHIIAFQQLGKGNFKYLRLGNTLAIAAGRVAVKFNSTYGHVYKLSRFHPSN